MSKAKKWVGIFLVGMMGALAGFGLLRAVYDYLDFIKMRSWVAEMQALQKQAAQQQAQRPAQAPEPAK